MRGGNQRGFTLVAALAAMFLLALATQGVMAIVSQQAQRDREVDLIRIGHAYVKAIGSYYESSPGSAKQFPRSLAELTEDRRFVGVKRHLREEYSDPVNRNSGGKPSWGLLPSADGGVAGVYSLSEGAPLRTAEIDLGDIQLPASTRYAGWQFAYIPRTTSSAPGQAR